jgi:hypothetical protein
MDWSFGSARSKCKSSRQGEHIIFEDSYYTQVIKLSDIVLHCQYQLTTFRWHLKSYVGHNSLVQSIIECHFFSVIKNLESVIL